MQLPLSLISFLLGFYSGPLYVCEVQQFSCETNDVYFAFF